MQEPSYMIIIPANEEDIKDPSVFIENLKKNAHVHLKSLQVDEERGLVADFEVDGKPYQAEINPTDVEIPEFVRPQHAFTKEEIERIDGTKTGLSVCMDYEGDSRVCFYDQLRFINEMFPFPGILAVMDCPSEKLLSGKWVALAANSSIMPAPRYLFTVQAVSDEDGEVWLHTHGLKRCGLYELEILCSDKDKCNDHYKMIETFACRMLESEEPIQPGEGVFLAQAGDEYLVCTAVDWKEALKHYPDAKLGTEADREDEVHGEDTYVLMLYESEEAENTGWYTPISNFDPYLKQNPMYMFSNEETERMSRLAIERLPYIKKAFGSMECTIIVKIGLPVDEEYRGSDLPEKEHIWFELKDLSDDMVVAELTQEPYYVSGIKEGDIAAYPFSSITDWIIFTPECRITPDDVYMLNNE